MNSLSADATRVLIGHSTAIQEVRTKIAKAATSSAGVLLLGESGTGKEVVARLIHENGPGGPFVPIDCGSLVGTLMESELFGHAKGAFTGAVEARRGLIEAANGGTAFLDEIGDLALELQVKLLRLLQEREYRPVGSVQSHKVSVRVISATHRNLKDEVDQKRFRQDLYYRLNVVTIHLPALRDRKEDIPLLIEHFLGNRRSTHVFSRDALDALVAYDWPGNVRELQNAVDRMTAMNSGPVLHSADLPTSVLNQIREQAHAGRSLAAVAGLGTRGSIETTSGPLPQRSSVQKLVEVEKDAIGEALEHTQGDMVAASYLLGIGRTTLYRKLKGYGVTPGAPLPATTPIPCQQSGEPSFRIYDREKHAILEALEQTKGDMVAAAYLLDIGRTTLYRKLSEYGIKR